jgi:hypothetical protein
MKPGMNIMASELISTAYFINPSHQFVCLHMYPLIVARQQLGKRFRATTNTRKNRRTVGRVVYCTVRVVSKESLWVSLCIVIVFVVVVIIVVVVVIVFAM